MKMKFRIEKDEIKDYGHGVEEYGMSEILVGRHCELMGILSTACNQQKLCQNTLRLLHTQM